jgi:cell division septation protein DedD
VTEVLHDAAEDGFHEIQLTGKQLVFLFIITTVISVVIFLCGVLVGRGVRAEVMPQGGTESRAANPASQQGAQRAITPETEPASPPVKEELSYPKRLESEGTPPEDQLKPPPQTAKAPRAAATTGASSPPPSPALAPQGDSGPDGWVVQLVALRDRAAATAIVQRLVGKGYPAFLVEPTAGSAAPVYRVQVGRYKEHAEAEDIKRRLQKEEKFNPWISR